MPFTFKLSQRLARMRRALVLSNGSPSRHVAIAHRPAAPILAANRTSVRLDQQSFYPSCRYMLSGNSRLAPVFAVATVQQSERLRPTSRCSEQTRRKTATQSYGTNATLVAKSAGPPARSTASRSWRPFYMQE